MSPRRCGERGRRTRRASCGWGTIARFRRDIVPMRVGLSGNGTPGSAQASTCSASAPHEDNGGIMGCRSKSSGVSLLVLALAGAVSPVAAAPVPRAGVAMRPGARPPTAEVRDGGRRDLAGVSGFVRPGRRARFGGGGLVGDDIEYGLAGGLVGAAVAQPLGEAAPYGAPPFPGEPLPAGPFAGGPFPGGPLPRLSPLPSGPSPCARPQIITIGGGVRAAGKVRVVYGRPPCGS